MGRARSTRSRTGNALLIMLGLAAPCWPLVALSASPPSVQRWGQRVGSVFHIEKSENRNQVHYGIKVDDACRPKGETPVYGYWRDFEDGPRATSPLLSHEQPAYGLTRPLSIEKSETGGKVRIGLRGFPDRRLMIETFKLDVGCRALAFTPIAGAPAVLQSIYVELGFLFSIDYVLVRGIRVADGKKVQEKVED